VSDDEDLSPAALYEAAMRSAAAGDFHNALRLGSQFLAGDSGAPGIGHPDTLAMAALIPSWQLGVGDFSGALKAARELVPAATEVLGADHPSTVAARHTLACCDPQMGLDPAAALPIWVQLYADEQRVFGPQHRSTLGARHQIGELRRQLGDRVGARDELTATATDIRRLLGDHHPDSLAIQLAAAICVGEVGDTAAAVADFDRLIPLLTAVLGYDHQHTLLARHTRALWLPPADHQTLDRVSDWEILVDDEARALGEQHPLTVAGRQTLEEQRTTWRERLDTHEGVTTEQLIAFEIEDRGHEFDPQRPWGDFGSLDEHGRDRVAQNASDVRAELENLMDSVVAAKKAVGQAIREYGEASEACVSRRYELAQTLWRGHDFDAAHARTEPLITECSTLLGQDHPLTRAARALLVVIRERRWA
jgi:hypothetical protein